MKVSCLPVSFFPDLIAGKMSIRDWAEFACSLGFNGFDLGIVLVKNHTPTYLESLVQDINNVGIGITMITDYPDFTHPDRKQRERELVYLQRDIVIAEQLGAKYVRVTAGQDHPGIALRDKCKNAVEYLLKAAEFGEKNGVTLVVENHSKPGAWNYFDITYNPDAFLTVVDGIRDSTIMVNFDTANAVACGTDVFTLMSKVADKIETIHAADTAVAGEFRPVVVGTGAVQFEDIFRRLRSDGFDGWICIEEWSNTGKEGVTRALDNIRTAWEQAV